MDPVSSACLALVARFSRSLAPCLPSRARRVLLAATAPWGRQLLCCVPQACTRCLGGPARARRAPQAATPPEARLRVRRVSLVPCRALGRRHADPVPRDTSVPARRTRVPSALPAAMRPQPARQCALRALVASLQAPERRPVTRALLDWQSCRRVCPCRRQAPKPAPLPTTATLQRCSRLAYQRSRAVPSHAPHPRTPRR